MQYKYILISTLNHIESHIKDIHLEIKIEKVKVQILMRYKNIISFLKTFKVAYICKEIFIDDNLFEYSATVTRYYY